MRGRGPGLALGQQRRSPAHAALAGIGLAILPTWMVGANVRRDALQVASADDQVSAGALDTSIHAVFPYARHLSPKVRALVDFLVIRFTLRPSWELDGGVKPDRTEREG